MNDDIHIVIDSVTHCQWHSTATKTSKVLLTSTSTSFLPLIGNQKLSFSNWLKIPLPCEIFISLSQDQAI